MRWFLLFLLALAFAWIELFIGGARLGYYLPGLCVIAGACVLTALIFRGCSRQTSFAGIATTLLFASYILVRNRLSEVEYIGRLQFFIMAGCVLIYLLFATVITRPSDRKIFFYILMVYALAQVIVGIGQFFERNQWMPLPWAQRRDDTWRASGLFISPNNYAGYLEVIAVMAMAFAFWARQKIAVRLLLFYVAIVAVGGLAISGSRGGYLGVAVGMAVLVLMSLIAWAYVKRTQVLPIALGAVLTVVILLGGTSWFAMQNPHIATRLMTINDTENMRLLLWDSAMQQFSISPVVGTGGASYLYYGRLFRDSSVQNDPIHVHNDYIQLLAEYGIVGAALFLIFFLIHVVLGLKAVCVNSQHLASLEVMTGDSMALVMGGLSALAAYTIHAVVEFNLQIPADALMMAAIFGILANGTRPVSEDAPLALSSRLATILGRILLPASAVALLIYAIPMILPEYYSERARIALRDNKVEDAITFAKKGLEKNQDNPDLFFYAGEASRALACAQPEQVAEALPYAGVCLNQALAIFPYDTRIALRLAQTYSIAGDYARATQVMDYAQELDPLLSLVYIYRGYIELAGGYPEEALEAFEQAREVHIPDPETVKLLNEGTAQARKLQEFFDKQDEHLEKAFLKLPTPVTLPNEEEDDSE